MNKYALSLILFISSASAFCQTYKPNWESLNQRKIPEWFHDAKFGIFIHWGVYAVPAYAPVIKNSGYSYSEWYWKRLDENQKDFRAFHNENYGNDFQYPQFESSFKAELYEPEYWAKVFANSGAKYVVLTSKHHEGYALWNSAEADKSWQRPWNAVTGTPKRDLLGDLSRAVRDEGLKMGYYYSLYEWFNPLWKTDKKKYVEEHMFPQFKDLVTRYKPSIIFSDGEWDLTDTAWKSEELLAWLYNESPVKSEVVVNDRWGSNTRGKNTGSTYTTSEYGSGMDANVIWEESRGIGHSYGYNRNEKLQDYKTGKELILILTDVVARGGNLLLDIGPTADGRIPVIMQERLNEIGEWLKINGEAIYETTPYSSSYQWSEGDRPQKSDKSYMSGYDISELVLPASGRANIQYFFTKKGDDLYCIVPTFNAKLSLKNIKAAPGTSVTLLGRKGSLPFKQVDNSIEIDLSAIKPGEIAAELFVVKLQGALKK